MDCSTGPCSVDAWLKSTEEGGVPQVLKQIIFQMAPVALVDLCAPNGRTGIWTVQFICDFSLISSRQRWLILQISSLIPGKPGYLARESTGRPEK
jgi:hypothetical protein